MIPFTDSAVETVFDSYPDQVRPNLISLRDLIFTTAQKTGVIHDLTEMLKWGEPGYLCRSGSTVRIHWKADDPDHYRMFFHCQTILVPTFRELYPADFEYEGNRAIRFNLKETPDFRKLAHCIELALKYHQLKDLPRLGA